MADIDLVFAEAPGTTDLLFGGEQPGPVPPIDAVLVVTLPALTFTALAIPNAGFGLVAAGTVIETGDGVVTVELPGGGLVKARGSCQGAGGGQRNLADKLVRSSTFGLLRAFKSGRTYLGSH